MEGMPLRPNGGLFFARGDKDPKTGRNRLLARWVLGEFLRRQHETFRDPTVGWRKIGEGVNPQLPMEAGSPLCHASLYVLRLFAFLLWLMHQLRCSFSCGRTYVGHR